MGRTILRQLLFPYGPPLPPSVETVQLWSTICNAGGTYRNYTQRLAKAFYLLDLDTFWLTPAARNIAKGWNALRWPTTTSTLVPLANRPA